FKHKVQGMNTFAKAWLIALLYSQFAWPAAALATAFLWANQKLSQRLLLGGWIISFLLPIILVLIPAKWLFDFEAILAQQNIAAQGQEQARQALDVVMSLAFFASVLFLLPPIVVAFIFGV